MAGGEKQQKFCGEGRAVEADRQPHELAAQVRRLLTARLK
jgi:hypothetical protein